jgi:hypothetical protein
MEFRTGASGRYNTRFRRSASLPRPSFSELKDLMRINRRLGVLVGLLGVVGCSFNNAAELAVPVTPPAADQALPADTFDKLAAAESQTVANGRAWLLPLWVDIQTAQLSNAADKVRYLDFSAFNLGLLTIPILPLWVGVDQISIDKAGARTHTGFGWTPLWAWSKETSGDDVLMSASGIPLLWGSVKISSRSDSLDLRIRHYLWSLGPTFIAVEKSVGDSIIDGYSFFPLLAGGLGGWLWASTDLRSDFGSVTAHGPLSGNLGYYKSEGFAPNEALDLENAIEMADDGEEIGNILAKTPKSELMKRTNAEGLVESTELWLGGILWAAWKDSDPNGAEVNGRHGPLWSMFGWGKEKGENTVILFWYPF